MPNTLIWPTPDGQGLRDWTTRVIERVLSNHGSVLLDEQGDPLMPNVTVPNLVGKTAQEAKDALAAVSLTRGPGSQTGNLNGNHLITAQSPAAGANVASGSAVAVTFNETHAYYVSTTMIVWGN